MINNFTSYKYSQSHRDILDKLEILAQAGLLADGEQENRSDRVSPWSLITEISLDAPQLQILTSNHKNKRKISLPSDLQLFIKDFCSGCIDTSIFVIDQLTKRVSIMVDITKKDEQLKHLRQTGTFLRDIETISQRNKKRTDRNVTKNQQKNIQEKLNIYLEKGEIIEIFYQPHYKKIKSPSLFEYHGFCLICHRYKDSKLLYCSAHTGSKKKTTEENSAIRSLKEQFRSAYNKLDLDCAIDSVLNAKKNSTYNSLSRKECIKKIGYKYNAYFPQQCDSLLAWSKHFKSNDIFKSQLVKLSNKFLDSTEFDDWNTTNISLFREVITLTKKHPHMADVFVKYLPERTNIIELQEYLFQTFFPQKTKNNRPTNLKLLKPIDFVFMLKRWSQINTIKLAAKGRL